MILTVCNVRNTSGVTYEELLGNALVPQFVWMYFTYIIICYNKISLTQEKEHFTY